MTPNDNVRVKLTDTGKRAIIAHVDDFNDHMQRMYPHATFRMKAPEWRDDWIAGQLWNILGYFKAEMWIAGAEMPFTEIQPI